MRPFPPEARQTESRQACAIVAQKLPCRQTRRDKAAGRNRNDHQHEQLLAACAQAGIDAY